MPSKELILQLRERIERGFQNPVLLEGEELCNSCSELLWRETARQIDDFIFNLSESSDAEL